MKELIRQLVESYGPSGCEGATRALIEGFIAPYADDIRIDVMGNLIAHKAGNGKGKKVMIAAHMDEIGLIVTHIDQKGFVRFGPIGGVQALTCVGGRVRFGNGAQGVIMCENWFKDRKMPEWTQLYMDVGATSPDDCPVKVGDAAGFVRPMTEMGNRLVAKSMDDRIACAVVAQTMMEIESTSNDLYFVFTTQEEVGVRGATTAAYAIEPEIGIAVDVTATGDTPECVPMAVALGDGPAVKVMDRGALSHPGVKDWMMRTAQANGIPYQIEVLQFGGTDASAMQMTRAGVAAGCLSIPARYVHTPSETVDYNDVLNSVELLVAMLSGEIAI